MDGRHRTWRRHVFRLRRGAQLPPPRPLGMFRDRRHCTVMRLFYGKKEDGCVTRSTHRNRHASRSRTTRTTQIGGLHNLSMEPGCILLDVKIPGVSGHTGGVPFPPLASPHAWRAACGRTARGLLHRMLLDADGVVVRGWRDESGLDCGFRPRWRRSGRKIARERWVLIEKPRPDHAPL